MAGMVVTTTVARPLSVTKITFDWLSDDADGTATGATATAIDGDLIGFTTIPDGGGAAPTDNYDVTVTDADGHDILLGAGLNRDTATTEHVTGASLAAAAASVLTVNVSNAGNANAGNVILYIR